MFLGTYTVRIDDKNRLVLPAKFRKLLESLVITRGQERCLYVFSQADFAEISEKIRQAPLSSKQARDYLRIFLSGASDEIPDKQHRIVISQPLRAYAGLQKEAVVIGAGNRAEIWDAQTWADYLQAQESAFSEIAEEVIPGLI